MDIKRSGGRYRITHGGVCYGTARTAAERDAKVRRVENLLWLLRYEGFAGIHTYHDCLCNRGLTRRGQCTACLEELLHKEAS